MSSLGALLHDLSLFELARDRAAQAATLGQIAAIAIERGLGSRAVRVCRLGLATTDAPVARADFYGQIAEALLSRGHARIASAAYRRAAEQLSAAGMAERAWGAELAAAIALSSADSQAGRRALMVFLKTTAAAPGPHKTAWLRRAYLALGELDLMEGRAHQAELAVNAARALSELAALAPDPAADSLAGRVELALGRSAAARTLVERALDGFAAHVEADGFAQLGALEAEGWLLLDGGDGAGAHEVLGRAVAMSERLGDRLRAVRLELLRASAFIETNPSEATRFILRAADRLPAGGARPRALVSSLLQLAAMLPSAMLAAELELALESRWAR